MHDELPQHRPYFVGFDLPARLILKFISRQQGSTVDGHVAPHDPFEPLYGAGVAILSYLRHLIRIMLAKDVEDGDVQGEHQDQCMAFGAARGENLVSVVLLVQIRAHFGDGPHISTICGS